MLTISEILKDKQSKIETNLRIHFSNGSTQIKKTQKNSTLLVLSKCSTCSLLPSEKINLKLKKCLLRKQWKKSLQFPK